MDEQHGSVQGRARVRQVFSLTGRGLVLVLENDFEGSVPAGGTVRGDRAVSAYSGPEFVDGWDESGARAGWIAVIATAGDAAQLFQAGDVVTFVP